MATSAGTHVAPPPNSNKRLNLTLYRELLRWCDGMDPLTPFSLRIPPLYLPAPNLIHTESLHDLHAAREGGNRGDSLPSSTTTTTALPASAVSPQNLLKSNVVFTEGDDGLPTSVTVPIDTIRDARNLFRALFRMNSRTTDAAFIKEQVTMAIDGIRLLHELTKDFDNVRRAREGHRNREGVRYRVGQVVQVIDGSVESSLGAKRNNINMQARGVIVGWERQDVAAGDGGPTVGGQKEPGPEWHNPVGRTGRDDTNVQASSTTSSSSSSSSSSTKTSLTVKSYQSTVPGDHVRYDVILDVGDLNYFEGNLVRTRVGQDYSDIVVYQSSLKLVEDPDLLRIRFPLGMEDLFQRFDPISNSFVLNPDIAYLHPSDGLEAWEGWQNPSDPAARDVIGGVQDMAAILRRTILDHTNRARTTLQVLEPILEPLTKLCQGDVLPSQEALKMVYEGRSISDYNTQRLMKFHLDDLGEIGSEIGVHLWRRRTLRESQRKARFGLGEVVRHKKYGFRGVIVAWDPQPVYEVTHWDGLQHIDRPEQYPFYHVIPDPSDTVAAFGLERPWRYVCEENLESCPKGDRRIDVDLEPDWTYDSELGSYVPPDLIRFRHGCDLEDDGMTERCLREMRVREPTASWDMIVLISVAVPSLGWS
jgi:heat shock protein HspQ